MKDNINKIDLGNITGKFINTIKENNMINDGDRIIVALSGGPDSMCLLHLLHSLRESYDLKIYAAHVNHMLRGVESDTDEEVCRRFCEKLNIDFYSRSIDIEKIASEKGISTEMAGRDVRYEFFEELMVKVGANKVAVAHNQNDQAETVLMRMMRGTGIEGLVGIKAVRDEIFIRPIINVTRAEIEAYCEIKELPARIDKTNFEPIYSRNKVRLELIPYIEKNFNGDIVATLSRMCELIKKDEDYIQENVTNFFEKVCDITDEKVIIYNDAFNLHPAIVSRIIRKALLGFKGHINNIQSIHIDNVIKIQKSETGKFTILPKNILVTNVYGNIEITNKQLDNNHIDKEELKNGLILSFGDNYIKELGINVKISMVNSCKAMNFKGRENIKYFNFDNVKNISVRLRREGDRFIPFGMKGSKKLKDVFMDLKMPREKRNDVPLLCFDEEISWIIGYRISEKFKIHGDVKNILEVRIERQEDNEKRY